MSYEWKFEAPPGTDGMLQKIWYSVDEKKWKIKCKGTYTIFDLDKFNNSNMNDYDKTIINLAIENHNLLLHPTIVVEEQFEEERRRVTWHEAARWTYFAPSTNSGNGNQIRRIYCEKVLEEGVQKYIWFVQLLNRRIYRLRGFEKVFENGGLSVQDLKALLMAKEKERMTNLINLEEKGVKECSLM